MLTVSQRAQNTIASPIRKFLPLAQEAEKRGVYIYKLNVGDPDMAVPSDFWDALRNYKDKTVGYAPSPGIREHTEAWVKYYSTFGVSLRPEDIIPTVGCAEAILLAMIAICDPGDELIVFEPLYSSYKSFAVMCGIALIPITLQVENNFQLPSEEVISKKITPKTKGIVLINPNNPTGTALSEQELLTIIRVAKKHHLFILSDETYRELVFDIPVRTLFSYTDAHDHAIVLDSVSKKFSAPGLRIGSLASFNKDVIWSVLKFAMARLSAPTLEQYALIPLLSSPTRYTKPFVLEYQRRKDTVVSGLQKIPGVICHPPKGAFYIIAKLPVENSEKFVEFMLTKFHFKQKTVMVTPAEDFYITPARGRDEIRIAYVLNTDALRDAMEILQKGLEAYKEIEKA